MYNASSAFHTAAQGNAPQIALLIFEDAIFSNSDINVQNGLEFHDYFNTEEDIGIGQALSNEIRFTLFNDARLLNEYEFGEFKAMLGVRISTGTYTDSAQVITYDGNVIWRGMNRSPYLTRNGSAVASQPTWPVRSIAVYGTKVYAFGASGQCKVYTNGGTALSDTINSFMQNKVTKWGGLGFNLNVGNRILKIYGDGKSETYEFVPLGTFIAERPDSPDKISIDLSCHDRMELFDKDMPDASTLGITYPTTIGTLLSALCTYAGIPSRVSTFINSTATIRKEPEQFKNANMRTVLSWIAEAAGSNAGFDRDGYLVLKWLQSTNIVINEYGYASCVPKYYETKKITKLYKRNTSGGADETVGTGDNGYLIQDNPLLNG